MFIFFLLGLAIGSFLNVVINRTESGEDVVSEPSHCPKCRKKLLWYELVPLFSFVVQIGKCRGCGQRISSQYPLVELFTGVFFALAYLSFSFLLLFFLGAEGWAGETRNWRFLWAWFWAGRRFWPRFFWLFSSAQLSA